MEKVMSFEDLKALRDQFKEKVVLREKSETIETLTVIKVSMCTRGIAAGSRDILTYLVELVAEDNLDHIVVKQDGCIGNNQAEPMVEVIEQGKEPIIYECVDKEKVKQILFNHGKR